MDRSTTPVIKELRFENASFKYEDGDREIFHSLSLELPMDRNVFVSGVVGSGQSTLLKLLAVLLQPQEGRFLINGLDTTEMSFEEFLPLRRQIGYTFDYGGLFANRTLLDNLTLPLLYHKILSYDDAQAECRALIERFRFAKQMNLRPASVSGGLRKLVCVLRAFVLRPQMMVMDDPFTGLDAESAKTLLRLIGERRESGELKHVFFTSRDEVWPAKMDYEPLIVDERGPRLAGKAA